MKYTRLPNTDISVSKLCLGTMTWGEQNTEQEAHQQLDYALQKGINFIDTAELYAVPAKKETQGATETIIGKWLQKTGKRDKIVLATKIVGPREFVKHIRTGGFTKSEFSDAIHKSLKRLQTDYIDLYQLHWPDRNTNFFGVRGYEHDADEQWQDNFAAVLSYLEDFIKEGKIRQIGLSNETPYGVMRYAEEARKGAPKMITVQNPYSLLNRKDEIGLTEILHRENIGHLPYSPLGFGQLTGKYLDETPPNARVTLFPQFNRYHNTNSFAATRAYNEIAKEHNISLTKMALSFVTERPFVTSTIIGATTMEQLKENIDSINISLSKEILQKINEVHNDIPNPAP
ncbi:aldo/keto reductase [Aquimarina brevivitae]|uniref:Protein tas n=1 Tax=Aquimarina brevivitae TaxID=323412 RepID=A0A4V2F7D0_9FLAO|nr:aldo/keto reductase [Aquimarina brevivitae]RZS99389.1 aryl-alcohol dehydrogenase-like predicted oxidoreductase [Aquimarina brevivitae]